MNRNWSRGRHDAKRLVCRAAKSADPIRRFFSWWRWCLRHGGISGTDRQRSRFAGIDSLQGLLNGCDTDAERIDLLTHRAGKYSSQSVTRDNAPLAPAAASMQT